MLTNQHCHLVTSSHFSWNLVYYSRNPHLKELREIFWKKDDLGSLYGSNFSDVSSCSVVLEPKIRQVTSCRQIFIKLSANISFLYIFEVICIIWRKVMNISVFQVLYGEYRNSPTSLQKAYLHWARIHFIQIVRRRR